MDVKKIYSAKEAMVSDALFESSDDVINATIKDSTVGMVIYTAGYNKMKQKSLSGKWIAMAMGGGAGASGGVKTVNGVEPDEAGNVTVTTEDTVARDAAAAAQTTADGKMGKADPIGTGSLSIGRKNGTTTGVKSSAVGWDVTATGQGSHAEGYGTIASQLCSHAEGNVTTASGGSSHAEGYNTTASGESSHAEGYNTTASGENSHAEGYGTKAIQYYAHAEGSETTASGYSAHSEGYSTAATGNFAHAEGQGTKAAGIGQHAQGKYNVEDTDGKYAHIVGNGTSGTNPSNAHTLDWDGNAWFAGNVEGTMLVANANDMTVKLYASEEGVLVAEDANGVLREVVLDDSLSDAITTALQTAKNSGDFKGDKGDPGTNGKDGADGVSVTSIEQTTTSTADGGENVVTVTLSNGNTSTFTVKNGTKGATGAAGKDGTNGTNGTDGKTPVKGTDYWTEADKQEIIDAVLAAIAEQKATE